MGSIRPRRQDGYPPRPRRLSVQLFVFIHLVFVVFFDFFEVLSRLIGVDQITEMR